MRRQTALILFILVLVTGIFLARGIGVTWDEADNIFAGGVYVTFFKEGFNPHAFDGFWNQKSYFADRIFTLNPELSHYPPVPLYVGSALSLIAERAGLAKTGPQLIYLFHIATVLFLALLVATVYRFGRFLKLPWGLSVFAAVVVWLFPTIFGHGLSNLKDTAQVTMVTMSLFYLVKGDFVWGAIVWGLALATKFNAVYVPIIWGIWEIRDIRGLKKLAGVVALGLVVAFAVWPYLWFDPVTRIPAMFHYFTSIGEGYTIYWYGKTLIVGGAQSLWWYPWVSFLIMTPVVILGLGVLGVIREIWEKRILLLAWLLVPMARTVLPHAAFYDGLRHFMEVIPALSLLAAVGLGRLGKWWGLGGILVVLYLVFVNAVYFPFSTGYYNFFTKNPDNTLDRDIEALSVKPGIDWVHAHAPNAKIWIPIAAHTAWPYVGHDELVGTSQAADYIIVVNKLSHRIKYPDLASMPPKRFTTVYTVTRGGNTFGWVFRRY